MKSSQIPLFTSKDSPADAQVKSHIWLSRAGYIKKQAAGLYIYLPFGLSVHQKIENIVREEMNNHFGVEVQLPVITPAELWQQSGRWSQMGSEMMRLSDRHNSEFNLAPTHEESISSLAANFLQSYKQLPINLYQIGKKYRDEMRPRYGLIRCREFVMKDAYSFHIDDESLNETYELMRECYRKIFTRCGLKTISVEADSGSMGGAGSEEFMVASEIGEENLLICSDDENCGFRSNQEKTPYVSAVVNPPSQDSTSSKPTNKVETINKTSIEELSIFLEIPASKFIKTVVFQNEENIIIACVRGDKEINITKLQAISQSANLIPATETIIKTIFGCESGYISPYNLEIAESIQFEKQTLSTQVYFDQTIFNTFEMIVGANEKNFHITGISSNKHFGLTKDNFVDIVNANEGDLCPQCKKEALILTKGIEVGHIFKLGTKYTQALNVSVLDENGKTTHPTMGCYGIGIGRTLATVIEQNSDEVGLVWPRNISPYEIYLVSLAKKEDEVNKVNEIYTSLNSKFSTYLDERKERPGVKFTDSEIVGFPVSVVIGKNYFQTGEIEIRIRKTKEKISTVKDQLLTTLNEIFENID